MSETRLRWLTGLGGGPERTLVKANRTRTGSLGEVFLGKVRENAMWTSWISWTKVGVRVGAIASCWGGPGRPSQTACGYGDGAGVAGIRCCELHSLGVLDAM